MKKIEAIIRPHKRKNINNALNEAGFIGFNLAEVSGYEYKKGYRKTISGNITGKIEFVPKLRLELDCPDNKVEEAISILINTAKNVESAVFYESLL